MIQRETLFVKEHRAGFDGRLVVQLLSTPPTAPPHSLGGEFAKKR